MMPERPSITKVLPGLAPYSQHEQSPCRPAAPDGVVRLMPCSDGYDDACSRPMTPQASRPAIMITQKRASNIAAALNPTTTSSLSSPSGIVNVASMDRMTKKDPAAVTVRARIPIPEMQHTGPIESTNNDAGRTLSTVEKEFIIALQHLQESQKGRKLKLQEALDRFLPIDTSPSAVK